MMRQGSPKQNAPPSWPGAVIVLGATLWLAAGSTVAAQEPYETPPILQASAILPSDVASGPNHQSEERVVNDGYVNTYSIQSRFGRFTPISTAQLRVRIDEIGALAKMETVTRSKEFKESVSSRSR